MSNELRRWIRVVEGQFYHLPMVRVYHAQSHLIPAVLKARQVANYNSMGTWFTNSREKAGAIYGQNITAYDIPAEGYLEVGHDDVNATIGINGPLIAKHFGKPAALHLEQHPWNVEARQELRDLERWQQQSEQVEPWRVREPKVARMKALRKSLEISRQALKSAAYCQDFRSMIEGDIHDHGYGHRGLVWRSVKFDGWTGEPADIYLLFHKEDIHPAPNHGAA